MLTIIVLAAVCFCGTVTLGQVTTTEKPEVWAWYQIPNPQKQFAACGRRKPSYICDPNNILPYRCANEIDRLIQQTMNETECPCPRICRHDSPGYMVSVLLIPEFYTPNEVTSQYQLLQMARSYVYSFYSQNWDFGRCKEYVIIFYSKKQYLLYTMTGRRAREKISDATVENISEDVRDYFNAGPSQDICAGLTQMIKKYRDLLVVSMQGDDPRAIQNDEKIRSANSKSEYSNGEKYYQKGGKDSDDYQSSRSIQKGGSLNLLSALVSVITVVVSAILK